MVSKTNHHGPLRVVLLRVHNVLGAEDAEIEPGQVTIIEGKNGSGKTSRIEAFKAVLKGGHDATLLRKGAESGEIVMVLSDGVEIRKRIGADKSDTLVTHPEFGKLSKPASYLDGLRDAFAVNPVDFLTAKPETRVKLLLDAIPLTVNPIDLAGIVDYCTTKPDLSRHALPVLAEIEKDLRDQRTGINRAAKDKRSTIEELVKALPPESNAADSKTILDSVELEYSDFRTNCETAKAEIQKEANSLVSALDDEKRKALDGLIIKRDDELEEIRGRYGRLADDVRGGISQRIQLVSDAVGKELDTLAQNRATKTQQFESALATARANAETYIKAQGARDHIKRMEDGAATLEADSEALSTALTELDNVRGNLLEKLPIKGVTVSDGDMFVDGVAFDRVNESKRVRLAFEVAGLRSGNLPFMVIDGAERCDSSTLEQIAELAVEKRLQLVLSKVTDGPLEVSRIA